MSTIKTENNGVTTTITATGEINTRENMVTGTGIGIGTGVGSGTTNVGAPFGSGAFQLPNLVTATAPTTTSTMTRNNISVTNIKCELVEDAASTTMVIGTPNGNIVPVITSGVAAGYYNGSSNGGAGGGSTIRIPLTKAEDSDSEAELTNIENLKVTRRVVSTSATTASGHASADHKNGPRPMSWEGELSETETTETELMETENSLSNSGVLPITTITVIKSEATTTTTTMGLPIQSGVGPPVGTHTLIKPELEQSSSGGGVGGNSIDLQYSPHTKLKLGPTQSDPINLKYEPPVSGEVNSPLLARQKSSNLPLPANPSPDSAIHSVYTHSSPSQSPLTSRHAPYTPSLSRNNSDASHSSCYSYSSEFSPTHSPIQGRHAATPGSAQLYGAQYNGGSLHHSMLYRPISLDAAAAASEAQNLSMDAAQNSATTATALNLGNGSTVDGSLASSAAGISRQQLINSPCPICGDKISGFHYGIFSCESCKGFFKRTVQNRKNYVCVRGGPCSVSISTRKKCPACRFEKCLQKGMKLEAIREDRTRGGRSTYQCSYTLPNSMLSPLLSPDQQGSGASSSAGSTPTPQQRLALGSASVSLSHGVNGFATGALTPGIKKEQTDAGVTVGTTMINGALRVGVNNIPVLMQEIMDVEHLWRFSESELTRLNQPFTPSSESSSGHESSSRSGAAQTTNATQMTNPLLASAGFSSCNGENADPYLIAHLCSVADHRLYKIVKWCKSLPLFKNISIDDQICLLINSWCELLLFSCCFRSVDTPGQIKLSQGKKLNLSESKLNGTQPCIERMLNLTDQLRRLRVDSYEYVTLKVIVLLQSDTSELKEPVKVRECQEQALQCLQNYTLAHYPDTPSKFGELLLRIPELQRTCQLGKEMLTVKSHDGSDFNLLMELLRGEH